MIYLGPLMPKRRLYGNKAYCFVYADDTTELTTWGTEQGFSDQYQGGGAAKTLPRYKLTDAQRANLVEIKGDQTSFVDTNDWGDGTWDAVLQSLTADWVEKKGWE